MSPKIARKSENKRRSAVLESKLQEFEIGKTYIQAKQSYSSVPNRPVCMIINLGVEIPST